MTDIPANSNILMEKEYRGRGWYWFRMSISQIGKAECTRKVVNGDECRLAVVEKLSTVLIKEMNIFLREDHRVQHSIIK